MFVDYKNGSDEKGDGTFAYPYKTVDWALHESKGCCADVLSTHRSKLGGRYNSPFHMCKRFALSIVSKKLSSNEEDTRAAAAYGPIESRSQG